MSRVQDGMVGARLASERLQIGDSPKPKHWSLACVSQSSVDLRAGDTYLAKDGMISGKFRIIRQGRQSPLQVEVAGGGTETELVLDLCFAEVTQLDGDGGHGANDKNWGRGGSLPY